MDPTIEIIIVTDSNGRVDQVYTTHSSHDLHVHIIDCHDIEVGEQPSIYGYPIPLRVGETAQVIADLTQKARKKYL